MSPGPVRRLIRRDRHLRVFHVYRVPPGVLGDRAQRLPHAGDPLGADREEHAVPVRGAGQLSGEIARVGAQRDLPSRRGRPVADGPRQRGQRPGQQPHHVRARVLVPGQQVGGQRDLGLRPRGHVRPARPLPLVVIGHPAFLAAVHLHVGGVDVDRHRPGSQLGRPLGGKQVHHPRGRGCQARLGPPPVRRGEPAHDPGRGRGRQPGHRHQLLPRLISAHPVQPDQEILPGQLGRGHPGQHLPAGEPPRPLLDRPDALIQRRGQAELAAQLGHRDHPARPRQRRVGRPDLDPAAGLARHSCCQHHLGDSPPGTIQHRHAR